MHTMEGHAPRTQEFLLIKEMNLRSKKGKVVFGGYETCRKETVAEELYAI